MKELLLIAILLFCTSIQAKERTVEEALANSEVFLKKARAFQKDFGKDDGRPTLKEVKPQRSQRPQLSNKEYKTVNLTRVDIVEIDGKRIYCDINIDLETTSSQEEMIELMQKAIIYLNIPTDKGYYIYQDEEAIYNKLLDYLKNKSDIKSLKIKKFILQ